MKLLLDTHCWLWLQVSPERLGSRTLELLADLDNELLLSAASSWADPQIQRYDVEIVAPT